MFKKAVVFVLATVICFGVNFKNLTEAKTNGDSIGIYVNEKEIKTDVTPFIKNGTTFVPVRSLCNALGIDNITWDESEKSVHINTGENQIKLWVGKSYAYKNGKKYELTSKCEIKDGRTMIPLRFVCESLGAEVLWDGVYSFIDIKKDGVVVSDDCVASNYTKDDVRWLSKIIEAESTGEPKKGQIAVGNVVLNRVKSPDYPNTIYGVIFDKKHGVQFQPVINNTIYNTPSKSCVDSARRAMSGENYAGDSLYFLNESIATNTWIVNNREYYTTINNHSFYV